MYVWNSQEHKAWKLCSKMKKGKTERKRKHDENNLVLSLFFLRTNDFYLG